MIQVVKGTSNTVIMTLREKQSLASPTFLFRFISEGGLGSEQSVIMADSSSYTDRYNKFTLIEGTTITLVSGIYQYEVYEQTSTTNTDYRSADVTTPLEVGLMFVKGTANEVFQQPTTTTRFTWQTS